MAVNQTGTRSAVEQLLLLALPLLLTLQALVELPAHTDKIHQGARRKNTANNLYFYFFFAFTFTLSFQFFSFSFSFSIRDRRVSNLFQSTGRVVAR